MSPGVLAPGRPTESPETGARTGAGPARDRRRPILLRILAGAGILRLLALLLTTAAIPPAFPPDRCGCGDGACEPFLEAAAVAGGYATARGAVAAPETALPAPIAPRGPSAPSRDDAGPERPSPARPCEAPCCRPQPEAPASAPAQRNGADVDA